VVDDLAGFPLVNPAVAAWLHSAVGVPLLLDGHLLGVLYSGSPTPRHFAEHEVRLLQLLADRMAVAVDRARLYESERAARAEAEEANARLRALQAVTDTALAHLDVDALLPALLDRVRDALAVDVAAVELLEEEGQALRVRAARGLDPAAAAVIPVGQGVAGRIAASREPLVVEDLSAFPVVPNSLFARQRSAAGVPLSAGERLLGTLTVSTDRRRAFSERDVHLLQRVAERVAVAVDRAELFEAERRAHAEAAARGAQLQAVLDAMTDGVVVYDRAGRGTYANPALRAGSAPHVPPDYGRLSLPERAAVVRMRTPAGEVVPEDELPQARLLRGETLAGAASPDLLADTPDGRTLTVRYAGSPLRDEAGAVTGAVMVLRDVTEERRLERAARELAAQLQATMDAMSDAVFLYDPEGRVLRLNAAARAFVGEQAEAAGFSAQPFAERSAAYYLRWPDGRPLAPEDWSPTRVLRGEQLPTEQAQDVLLTDAAGRERVMNYVSAPVADATGKLLGYVFVGRDVTEHRRTEQALRESEARFRTAFESSSISMVIVDTTGRLLEANHALSEILGYPRDDLLGRTFADLTYPDDVGLNLDLFHRALAGEFDSYHMEKRYVHERGHVVWGRISAGVVRDAAGRPLYIVSQMEDFTARKLAEEDREKLTRRLLGVQDEERRRLARELHDGTAQTITALNLNLTSLRALARGPIRDRAGFERLLADSQTLAEQAIRETRTLSYLLHPPQLDDAGLVPALGWYVQGFNRRSGIRVELEAPTAAPRLPEETERALFRVVQECLTNVYRHSGSATARVVLTYRARSVRLLVIDRGGGMAAPAERGEEDPDDVMTLGVGIPGMRERLRQLGGRLWIRSTARGTIVLARVPVAAPSQAGT
jgi:PAS domain S-box-containing protein